MGGWVGRRAAARGGRAFPRFEPEQRQGLRQPNPVAIEVPPGTEAAEFELSVSGREIDQAGMADLLEQVSASAVRTG